MGGYYLKEWHFFRSRLLYIFNISLAVLILITLLFHVYLLEHPEKKNEVKAYFQHEEKVYHGLNNLETCVRIFFHNVWVTIKTVFSGVIPFLFLPILEILLLGIPLGDISSTIALKGLGISHFIIRIIPHGIFEIPAILYSTSVGIYITLEVSKKIIPRCRKDSTSFLRLLKQACISYTLIIIPLLALGAIIETFITPLLLIRLSWFQLLLD